VFLQGSLHRELGFWFDLNATRIPPTNETHEIARRFCGDERMRGQAHAESLLDPQQELGALQTVKAEVALEVAVEVCRSISRLAGAQLAYEIVDDHEQPVDGTRGRD
jgi:hypothetical protein